MNRQEYGHDSLLERLKHQTEDLREQGLYKAEYSITSPQQVEIVLDNEKVCINLCANNYLGLANHPDLIRAAQAGAEEYGYAGEGGRGKGVREQPVVEEICYPTRFGC